MFFKISFRQSDNSVLDTSVIRTPFKVCEGKEGRERGREGGMEGRRERKEGKGEREGGKERERKGRERGRE